MGCTRVAWFLLMISPAYVSTHVMRCSSSQQASASASSTGVDEAEKAAQVLQLALPVAQNI